MKANTLVSAGLHTTAAQAAVGTTRQLGMTANGVTQATATALASGVNAFGTVAVGGAAVLLNEGAARISVCNVSANSIVVFPPLNGFLNTVLNSSVAVPVGKVAQFLSLNGTEWFAIVSA